MPIMLTFKINKLFFILIMFNCDLFSNIESDEIIDIKIDSISEPFNSRVIEPDSEYIISAAYQNLGTTTQFNITVYFIICDCVNQNLFYYKQGVIIDSLLGNENKTVTFRKMKLNFPYSYKAIAGVYYTLDENSTNDTITSGCILVKSVNDNIEKKNNLADIFPNPTNGEINIDCEDDIEKVKIFDILGNVVFESEETKSKYKINIIQSGMYFIQVNSNNQISYKKLLVL